MTNNEVIYRLGDEDVRLRASFEAVKRTEQLLGCGIQTFLVRVARGADVGMTAAQVVGILSAAAVAGGQVHLTEKRLGEIIFDQAQSTLADAMDAGLRFLSIAWVGPEKEMMASAPGK